LSIFLQNLRHSSVWRKFTQYHVADTIVQYRKEFSRVR